MQNPVLKQGEGKSKKHLKVRREEEEINLLKWKQRYNHGEAVLRVTNCLYPLFCYHKEMKMLSPLAKQKENISNTSLSVDALVFTDCLYFYFF